MLETSRLILKQLGPEDAGLVADFQMRNREFLQPYEPEHFPEYYTEAFWQKRLFDLLIASNEDKHYSFFLIAKDVPNHIIGSINFSNIVRGAFHACYLGYNLCQKAEGHGYMTEALKTSIPHVFTEKNIHRIMANYMPANTRSARVLAKLGFQIEGTAKEYLYIDGSWQDHVLTSLTNVQWRPESSKR